MLPGNPSKISHSRKRRLASPLPAIWQERIVSRRRRTLDARPGSPPEISVDMDALIFVMRPRGLGSDDRLVIRCDEAGEIWVAIVAAAPHDQV